MTELSHAAQAMLDAMYEVNMDFDGENATLAAAALEAVADLVVLDLMFPGDNGLTALRRLRDDRADGGTARKAGQRLRTIAAELRGPTTTEEDN